MQKPSTESIESIENKFARIRKGTHWFKIIGGYLYFCGWLGLLSISLQTTLLAIDGIFDFSELLQNLITVAQILIMGWCFRLLSSCMEAIDHLFQETKDVV